MCIVTQFKSPHIFNYVEPQIIFEATEDMLSMTLFDIVNSVLPKEQRDQLNLKSVNIWTKWTVKEK